MSFMKKYIAYRSKIKIECKKQNVVYEKNGQQLGFENYKNGITKKITWI